MALLGGGPGLYFDFATFAFHVPENMSAPYTTITDKVSAAIITTNKTSSLLLMFVLRFDFSFGKYVVASYDVLLHMARRFRVQLSGSSRFSSDRPVKKCGRLPLME